MQTLSDVHDGSFGTAFGVRIEGLPLALLARSVFVVENTKAGAIPSPAISAASGRVWSMT